MIKFLKKNLSFGVGFGSNPRSNENMKKYFFGDFLFLARTQVVNKKIAMKSILNICRS